jgi:hypothetical protein
LQKISSSSKSKTNDEIKVSIKPIETDKVIKKTSSAPNLSGDVKKINTKKSVVEDPIKRVDTKSSTVVDAPIKRVDTKKSTIEDPLVKKITKHTGHIVADDSILIIDPIHILPGEECKCGRPKTDFEKMGIKTYGDYLKKCCIRGKVSNPYGKSLKFAPDQPGLGITLHNYIKSIGNGYTVEYEKSKIDPTKLGKVIILFD